MSLHFGSSAEHWTPCAAGSETGVLVAQLDKASDYESEDWGFKSLQGYYKHLSLHGLMDKAHPS